MKSLFIKLSTILFVVMVLLSCNRDSLKKCTEHTKTACNEDANKTNIRIVNGSKFDFCNVVLNPSGNEANYGIINKGEASCYRTFDKAYSYAYVNLKIGEKTFTIQPIDYVGETPLGTGKFTYTIDVEDFNDAKLSIKANKD